MLSGALKAMLNLGKELDHLPYVGISIKRKFNFEGLDRYSSL